jgi:hypothetical protein
MSSTHKLIEQSHDVEVWAVSLQVGAEIEVGYAVKAPKQTPETFVFDGLQPALDKFNELILTA